MTTEEMSGAIFSECKKYRYVLWRRWDINLPMVMLIGLNPSTANADKNDNTITKVIKVTKNNEFDGKKFGGIYMLNLFAVISSNPDVLLNMWDPIGNNDEYLIEYANKSARVIFCWGNFKQAISRAAVIERTFGVNAPYCFEQNKNGSPKHPLYCKDATIFKPYTL